MNDPAAQSATEPTGPEPARSRLALMLTAVLPVAAVATAFAAAIGRLDTALFFVGVPLLLALVVGMLPTESSEASLFQVVTVVLLIVSAFLHEGALCVLIVSPLVYGIAFGTWWLVRAARRPGQRLALVPLLLLAVAEGVVPGLRISPHQEVEATEVVAETCTDFEAALDRGPDFDTDDRGWLLRAAQYPTPTHATGTGLQVGDTWDLSMPAGSITTRVTHREATRIDFDVVTDGARTTRWVTLTDSTLTWRQSDDGCEATVRIAFERDLDPSFWFGPVTELFMTAGADTFLRGLA